MGVFVIDARRAMYFWEAKALGSFVSALYVHIFDLLSTVSSLNRTPLGRIVHPYEVADLPTANAVEVQHVW